SLTQEILCNAVLCARPRRHVFGQFARSKSILIASSCHHQMLQTMIDAGSEKRSLQGQLGTDVIRGLIVGQPVPCEMDQYVRFSEVFKWIARERCDVDNYVFAALRFWREAVRRPADCHDLDPTRAEFTQHIAADEPTRACHGDAHRPSSNPDVEFR